MADLVKQVEKYLDPILAVELTRGDVFYHVDKIINIVLEEAAKVIEAEGILWKPPTEIATVIRAMKGKGDD